MDDTQPTVDPYARPFSEAEIEEMWETHAGDNPDCQTCRLLMTLAEVGAPGGRAADGEGLDVDRLAEAMHVWTNHEPDGSQALHQRDHHQLGESVRRNAAGIAAEYARLSASVDREGNQ